VASKRQEVIVGIFMLAGVAAVAWMSVRFGDLRLLGPGRYEVTAIFADVGGLRRGASVVIAGVDIGTVTEVRLENYRAAVIMGIDAAVVLQDDTIAAVYTRGLIGERFVELSPGASTRIIEPGGRIRDTLPARNLEQMLGRFVFGNMED